MNNKDNQIHLFEQWLAGEYLGKSGAIHEVLHAVSINPLHSPAMNSPPEYHPQPPAAVDANTQSGDELTRHPARGLLIKIPPTGPKPTGERIGHSCD